MDEETIIAKLKANVPPPNESEPEQPINPETPTPVNVAKTEVGYALDEMTQYKLHEFFGEHYRSNDEENRQRLSFIYEKASELAGTTDYGFVVAKMREIERIIGTSQSEDRMYKLYQWLKLDNARRKIDAEMSALV